MDQDKIIKLNQKIYEEDKCLQQNTCKTSGLQTNPILQKKFLANLINKKNKFSFKDLFK